MRITDGLVLRFVQGSMAAGRAAGYDPMLRIATGRQILRPADDPVSADRIAQLDERLAGLDRMNNGRERLRTDLSLADSVLQAAADAVSDAHEMAIRMANDSMGPDERAAAAQGVRDLIKRVSDLMNTQTADGRYLFAGTADDQPAYDTTTGAYLGSTGNRQVEIAPGTLVDGAINGDQLFGDPSDLLATLDGFATALETNDVTSIRDSIDNLDAQVHVVAQAQATVGFRLNGLDNAEDMVSQLEIQWLSERSGLKDVDLTTEITSLSAADTAYNAVLETSKRFLSMSLWRFLSPSAGPGPSCWAVCRRRSRSRSPRRSRKRERVRQRNGTATPGGRRSSRGGMGRQRLEAVGPQGGAWDGNAWRPSVLMGGDGGGSGRGSGCGSRCGSGRGRGGESGRRGVRGPDCGGERGRAEKNFAGR